MFKYIIPGIVFLALYAGSLVLKDRQIQKARDRYIPTVYDLQKKNGIPVYIETVKKGSFKNYVTLTGEIEGNKVVSFVAPFVKKSIKVGAEAAYETDAGKEIIGRVESAYGEASSLTGLYEVVVSFPGNLPKDRKVITVSVSVREFGSVTTVKREAINTRGDTPVAFILAGNTLVKKDIVIAGSNPYSYWIKSGLNPGDQVVISDTRYLNGGEAVEIIKPAENL